MAFECKFKANNKKHDHLKSIYAFRYRTVRYAQLEMVRFKMVKCVECKNKVTT